MCVWEQHSRFTFVTKRPMALQRGLVVVAEGVSRQKTNGESSMTVDTGSAGVAASLEAETAITDIHPSAINAIARQVKVRTKLIHAQVCPRLVYELISHMG